jgi:hypothetical protein
MQIQGKESKGYAITCVIQCSLNPKLYNWYHCYVRFEVFTVVTVKIGVFWDVAPCVSCKNRRFGGT